MKKQPLILLLIFFAFIAMMSGCMKKQNYPDTPEISLLDLQLFYDTAHVVRTGILSISYQDGNGDIGLDPADTFPPYQRGGPYYYNYVMTYFEKQNGVFNKVDLLIPFSLRIPVLNPNFPDKPIKGFIVDTIILYPPPLHDTIKFEAYIYDRALNKSNVVTTPEIILKEKVGEMERAFANRKFIIIGLFILIGIAFVIRLFFIQIIADKYVLSANNNVLRYITQYPARGLVYDRYGKLLVYNEAAYDLMVVPRQVKNIDTAELCHLLEIEKNDFIDRVEKARNYSPYRPSIFESQITRENYGYLEEKMFRFPGFFVQPRTLRKYTYPIAAHTFGYIGEVGPEVIEANPYYKSGDYIGISGVEKSYEEALRGKKGMKIRVVDVLNRDKGSFQGGKYDTIAYAGTDLYSSLDAELQTYGEMLMNGKKGAIVALEPSTGEILCMVTSPSYDPNLLVGRIRRSNYTRLLEDSVLVPLFNRALMASYPPGSTFKLVDALVGQQVGVLFPDTKYFCPGGFPLGNGKKVACHSHFSPLDLSQAIQHSCNTYFCRVFKSIIDKKPFTTTREGYETWRNLVMSFGFGRKFGIDVPGEMNGNIPSSNYYDRYHGKNRWTSMAIISLGIGQGEIGITPLQMANLAATISNRGYYYTPHIVKATGRKDNTVKEFQTKHYSNIDPKYFPLVVEAMHQVMEPGGTGYASRVEGIEICGKTGTAQNPHGKNHSIFVSFAPKDNPRIAVAVVVENAGFGATFAAPIASLMIEKYINREVKRKDIEQSMISGTVLNKGKIIDQ